jgi:hypothetical protein
MKEYEAGKNCVMRSFITRTPPKSYLNNQTKNNDRERACNIRGFYRKPEGTNRKATDR